MKLITLKKTALALAFVSASMLSVGAMAASQTTATTLSLSATVTDNCQVTAIQDTPITTNTAGATELDLTDIASINLLCTPGTPYSVSIDGGLNSGKDTNASGANALSDGAGHYIGYSLWQDSAWSVAWTVASPKTGTAMNGTLGDKLIIAGKLLDLNFAPAGTYTDDDNVVVTYN